MVNGEEGKEGWSRTGGETEWMEKREGETETWKIRLRVRIENKTEWDRQYRETKHTAKLSQKCCHEYQSRHIQYRAKISWDGTVITLAYLAASETTFVLRVCMCVCLCECMTSFFASSAESATKLSLLKSLHWTSQILTRHFQPILFWHNSLNCGLWSILLSLLSGQSRFAKAEV